jgi:hypothetical protein
LLEVGFKRAEMPKPLTVNQKQKIPKPSMERGSSIHLKTVTGVHLADLYLVNESLRIVPSGELGFNIKTPPFSLFFVERILAKMKEKDSEGMRKGIISPEKVLSYDISCDGDIILEVLIRNVTPTRVEELKSAIRWTLEKMWQKMSLESQ